jgi:hypothetical protein
VESILTYSSIIVVHCSLLHIDSSRTDTQSQTMMELGAYPSSESALEDACLFMRETYMQRRLDKMIDFERNWSIDQGCKESEFFVCSRNMYWWEQQFSVVAHGHFLYCVPLLINSVSHLGALQANFISIGPMFFSATLGRGPRADSF